MAAPTPQSASPRSVLLVIEPGKDGAFVHVDGLARWLIAQGLRVHLAYSSLRSGPGLQGLIDCVEARGGRSCDLRVSNAPAPSDVLGFRRLRRFVQEEQPDLIHAHSSKAGALVRLLPAALAPRRFYTPHAYFGLRPGRSFQGAFYNRIERFLAPRARTINVSRSEAGFAEVVLRIPPTRRRTIPNGIDSLRYRPVTGHERHAARAKLGLPQEARILLSVSRLSFQKDPHTLYGGFLEAARQVPNLHLLHLCPSPQPHYGSEALKGPDTARIHRFLEQQDPLPFYQAADGFVLSSRYEGLPLVALEALACGLPLILSLVSGNDDILEHRPNAAYWFPAGDIWTLSSRIRDWHGALDSANNHRELALAHYSLEACHARIFQFYQEAL